MRAWLWVLAGTITLGACGGSDSEAPPPPVPPPTMAPYPPGLSDQSMVVAGTARQFRVYVPPAVAQGAAPRA